MTGWHMHMHGRLPSRYEAAAALSPYPSTSCLLNDGGVRRARRVQMTPSYAFKAWAAWHYSWLAGIVNAMTDSLLGGGMACHSSGLDRDICGRGVTDSRKQQACQ